MKTDLWIACLLYKGKPTKKPNAQHHIRPDGTIELGNMGLKVAYKNKKGVYAAARYSGYDSPVYEDKDVIVYEGIGYYSKQREYAMFLRKTFELDPPAIDLDKIFRSCR